jgi:molecular chaperone GrpE
MADNDNETQPDTAPDQDGVDGTEDVAALKAEIADLRERHLRALAEAENTRRRGERERQDASQYAVTRFARDMLVVSDNLKRALEHFPADAREDASAAVKAVLEGIEATERQLASTLERHGVRAIDTADARFDPHLHQAIAEVPSEGKPAGAIVDVVQAGYVIADRLLRPAMVTVARSAGNGTAGPDSSAPGQAIDTKA